MAETFRGTVESLVRIEDRHETVLDFKLRAGPNAQRVRARLAVADWLREGDAVEADGSKDNEGILLADRVAKIQSPVPVQQLSGLFLIGLGALVNFVYCVVWAAANIAKYLGSLEVVVAIALLLGSLLVALPMKRKVTQKTRLLLWGIGAPVLVVGLAKLLDASGSLGPGFLILLLGFLGVCVYVIVRWLRQRVQRTPTTTAAG